MYRTPGIEHNSDITTDPPLYQNSFPCNPSVRGCTLFPHVNCFLYQDLEIWRGVACPTNRWEVYHTTYTTQLSKSRVMPKHKDFLKLKPCRYHDNS